MKMRCGWQGAHAAWRMHARWRHWRRPQPCSHRALSPAATGLVTPLTTLLQHNTFVSPELAMGWVCRLGGGGGSGGDRRRRQQDEQRGAHCAT